MLNRDESHHRSPRDVPPVGRPRGAVWRSLQADGVVWEGQVLLVGGEVDLAARMVVTHRRVAFVRGGEIALEVPRGWLRQEPVLRRDGILELFVATPDANPFTEPQKVLLRMREGHPAAGHIIAMLAPGGARRISSDSVSALERARESVATPTFGGFWDGVDALPPLSPEGAGTPGDAAKPEADATAATALPPLEPPDRLMRISSNPQRAAPNGAFPIAGIAPRDQRKSPWSLFLRLAALTVLLAAAAALGAGRLQIPLPIPGQLAKSGAILMGPTATPPPTQPEATTTATEPDPALTAEELTAVALGIGGPNLQATPSAASTNAAVAASAAAVIPTPAAQGTAASGETSAPTAIPATAAPAETAAPVVSSPQPAAATPGLALDQPASVDANAPPAQEIVTGPFRLTIDTALRAPSLPKYGLPPGSGEWLLLITQLSNESDATATLPMTDFRVFDRGTGTTFDLDGGVDVIASLAGIKPARTATDTVSLDSGASTTLLLLYLLPDGSSQNLALMVGQSSIDLAQSLTARSAAMATRPELLEATVSEVGSGGQVMVTVNGAPYTVQLLGMSAPGEGACYAAESAATLTQLIADGPVWLEREATDSLDAGVLPRDLWVQDAAGNRDLLAARMLEAGAATLNSVAPDTRYEAWLTAAAALGETNGAGLWSACPVTA